MGCVIGVDVGSQSVKAVVADEEGTALATASAPCTMRHPAGGWAEQDPERLDAGARRRRPPGARDGRARPRRRHDARPRLPGRRPGRARRRSCSPLRPAIIWLDRRATDAVRGARARPSASRRWWRRTGLNPDASHIAPEGDVAARRRARALRRRALAGLGRRAHERLADRRGRRRTTPMPPRRCCTTCGRAPGATTSSPTPGSTRERLPAIHPADAVIGTLRPEAADALGLSRHCRVIVGTGDDHAGAVGAGALAPGVIVDVTGTAEPVAVPSREPVLDEQRLLETHAHAVDGMLLVENPGFVSGGSTHWWAATQGIPQAELFGARRARPARQRRRALPPHAVRLDRAALERPHARLLRRPRAHPRRRAPGARRARGLRVRAARHRRPLRRARPRGRRDPRRRRRRALAAVAADQGRRDGPPGARRARASARRAPARRCSRASPTGTFATSPRPPPRRSSSRAEPIRPRPAHRAVYDDAYERATGACSTASRERST